MARLLEAAEGRQRVEATAVDIDLARTNTTSDPGRARCIGRPYRSRQSVDRIVRDLDCLVFGVVGKDRKNGPEDLLLGDRHVASDLREHGGAHEKALLQAFRRVDPILDVRATSRLYTFRTCRLH